MAGINLIPAFLCKSGEKPSFLATSIIREKRNMH